MSVKQSNRGMKNKAVKYIYNMYWWWFNYSLYLFFLRKIIWGGVYCKCPITNLIIHTSGSWSRAVNTLRPIQNGRRFADDTFKRIFLNENVRISIKISLKFIPKGPINNNPALVQIMAWPLSEPMMVSLLTHICVTRPQWVNALWPSDALWRQRSWQYWLR